MIRKIYVILILLVLSTGSHALMPMALTDSARVSFMTCGPGKEIFTKFGHSGIRIYDPQNGIDVVFQWGVFMFDFPDFILRFVLGDTEYQMGLIPSDIFLDEYRFRGSSVVEQNLNLTTAQTNRLWYKLCSDFDSERRYYLYNFIENNCSTKAYDEIMELYGGKAGFRSDTLQATSYRSLINEHVNKNSWYSLGINIIIGSDADTAITAKSTVTFPNYTQAALNLCHFTDHDGQRQKVVTGEYTLSEQTKPYRIPAIWYWLQIMVPILLTAVQLTFYGRHHKLIPVLTQLICMAYGVLGMLILFLWFVSLHPLVADNYNILWFNPLLAVLGVTVCLKGCKTVNAVISLLTMISILLYPLAVIFGMQYTNLPLMMWWLQILSTVSVIIATYRTDIKHLFSKQR